MDVRPLFMTSKQIQKESFDVNKFIEKTSVYKQISSWSKAANEAMDKHALTFYPDRPNTQLRYLREVAALQQVKPVVKVITIQLATVLENGRRTKKQHLTYSGQLQGTTKNGIPYAREFTIGKHIEYNTLPNPNQKYDPNTGEAKLNERVMGHPKTVYEIEVTDKNIKKIIDEILEEGNTFPENVRWYYVDLQDNDTYHHRDNTFTYEDFTTKTIEEIRNLSNRGGGSKTPGFYRDPKDGKMKDRDGNLI